MEINYSQEDCLELAKTLASHETSVVPTGWLILIQKWKKKNPPEFVLKTMITCFVRFTLEETLDKRKKMEDKLEKLVFETPVTKMPLYAVDASLKNPEGVFAEWRLKINK